MTPRPSAAGTLIRRRRTSLSLISRPGEVAELIEEAAEATSQG